MFQILHIHVVRLKVPQNFSLSWMKFSKNPQEDSQVINAFHEISETIWQTTDGAQQWTTLPALSGPWIPALAIQTGNQATRKIDGANSCGEAIPRGT